MIGRWRLWVPYWVAVLLTGVALVLIAVKFLVWGYRLEYLLPEKGYQLTVEMHFWEGEEGIRIATWLPVSDVRQQVDRLSFENQGIPPHLERTEFGTRVIWEGVPLRSSGKLAYTVVVRLRGLRYRLPDSLSVEEYRSYRMAMLSEYLRSTAVIQVEHPVIQALHDSLVSLLRDSGDVLARIRGFYAYVLGLENRPFKGTTDAVTAALLGEASCNGKSRLLVALLRCSGIPARLVGGIILTGGRKRIAHQWVEVFIQGMWVPLDPTNGHFAYLPENYLKLYVGDQPLFSFKKDLGFRYVFVIRVVTLPNRFFARHLTTHPLNAYRAWRAFQEAGIPLPLLTVVLMLPVGAFVISVFRNVVGLQTFGTFLPALIAAASVTTGLVYGLLGFLTVITVVSLLYYPLERWHVSHNPRMSILMVAVVSALLLSGWLAYRLKVMAISYLALFPVAVLTITAERMAQTILEEGIWKALWVTVQTALVIVVVYEIMTLRVLQSFFLAMPELYLVLVSAGLVLGRWTGIRLLEYWRFRHLMRHL